MRYSLCLLSLAVLQSAASILPSTQAIFSTPFPVDWDIPTVHESAVQARRILRLTNLATLATVFPSDKSNVDTTENRPSGLGGSAIGLMDYYADCESSGNPTILAIGIATSFKNVAAGSNISMSLRWHPQDGKWHSAAALPRFSLLGHLEDISDEEVKEEGVRTCFVKSHPDSVAWLPGNRIHESHWVRLVVDEIYWIGGFGDRAYIGWIPAEEWRSVTEKEIAGIELPGEKKGWGWDGLW
ncbi:pyridoxamine 5'-phosphate oxidase-like protein 5 [Elsinoe australis]|uniref:Pyridoxamine 5'-phosphate oxidase-like protein 5 n=1 Tax=Elsinoe australis TaxID=40998 RepID=A0A4V6DSY3_9PEZI|nr:pyridoxamine 5'-phosphate oxidase-like protein 5 [Elsinoe australis]